MIRKLGSRGHKVFATDTFRTSPGSHSKYVERALYTESPRTETAAFIRQIREIIDDNLIELVLPSFEEVFYLARHVEELPRPASYFFPDFAVLQRLHDKSKLADFAEELGLRVPRRIVARSQAELREALREIPDYFARPVFSRGGVELLTSRGPLAGTTHPESFEVSPEKPWLVTEFIAGLDVCSFSVVHHGRVTGHATYVHPREIEHAGGIVFESVDEPESLHVARTISEATRYHGHISFDFRKTPKGLVLIECNPRPTAGLHVMSPEDYEAALFDHPGEPRIVPPGVRRKYSVALLRDMLLHPREARDDVRHLLSDAKEVVAQADDLSPALFQVLSYGHVLAYRLQNPGKVHHNKALMAAYFDDVCWNGEAIQ